MVVRSKVAGTAGNGKDSAKSSSSSTTSFSTPDWSDEEHDSTLDGESEGKAKIMLFSESGVGKTDFICRNAPDPIIIFDFDGRSLRTVKKVRLETGKVIRHVRIFTPGEEDSPEETKLFARSSIAKTIRNLKWAVKQSLTGGIKTIGFDGATEYTLLAKQAYDGVKEQTKDGAFGKDKDYVKHQFWRVVNIVLQGQAHFIITAREKEIWKDNKPTDDFSFRADSVINEAVDFSLQLRQKDKLSGEGKKYEIKIIKCGVDDRLDSKVGKVYKEGDWQEYGPFAVICADVYGGDVTDWL